MSSRWDFTLLNANWAAKAAVAGADHQPLTVCPRAETVADKITGSRLGKHVLPRNALQTEACEPARLRPWLLFDPVIALAQEAPLVRYFLARSEITLPTDAHQGP